MAHWSWGAWLLFTCLWLSSNAKDEVTICHNPDSGNPQTLTVSSKTLYGFLNQGDYVGRCSSEVPVSLVEVEKICSQKDLPICQCPQDYNWWDGRVCATHCMSVQEDVCYHGISGIPLSEEQCGKYECRSGHVRCRKPDLEPVRENCNFVVSSLHRHLLAVPSPSLSPLESPSPSESPSESPSPSDFPFECCEDLPVCQCHDSYDYKDFGEVCDTHCMELDRLYCHPGKLTNLPDLTPCSRYACAAGQVRCRRPPVNPEPPRERNPGTFFLARGGESCDDACAAVELVCDADLIQQVAETVAACKDVLEHMNKTVPLGGEYDEDNSGCTYHPDAPGWYQVFKKDGAPPKCSERNPDVDRLRVCACQSKREEREVELADDMGDQSFCADSAGQTVTTEGRMNLASGVGGAGTFICNCADLCELSNRDGNQSNVSLTNYTNYGKNNTFSGMVIEIQQRFENTIEGAVFTLDASSALEILSGGAADFKAASTFAGAGVFRAKEGCTVSFSAASTFQVATEVSGQFLVESNTVSFEEKMDLTGSNALMHVKGGSRLVASRAVTVSSSSEIKGTSGTMQFDGGLSMASSSTMSLSQTTVSVSTLSASSSTMSFSGSTVTSQTWSMSSSTVTIGAGSAMSVSGGAELDGSTMELSSSTSTFTSSQASTLRNGGRIRGRGGCNMQFTGGLQTTSGSTMDLQQSTVGVGHLQMSSSTLTASSSTAVTASQVTFSQTTVQMTSTTLTSSGAMSDNGGSLTFTTSAIVVTSTFTSTSSSYTLTGSSMTVTQQTKPPS